MPPFETMDRHDKAVLWPLVDFDNNGNPRVSNDPVEIDVRWTDVKKEVVGPNGTPISIDAYIVADQYIPPGSEMWKGSIKQLPGTGLTADKDVMTVVTMDSTNDIKKRFTRYDVYLSRAKDALQTRVAPS